MTSSPARPEAADIGPSVEHGTSFARICLLPPVQNAPPLIVPSSGVIVDTSEAVILKIAAGGGIGMGTKSPRAPAIDETQADGPHRDMMIGFNVGRRARRGCA